MTLSLHELRQASAELLAYAVCDLFPEAQLVSGGGSAIGFHYDFVIPQQLDHQLLIMIEERMLTIVKGHHPVKTLEMMRENAISFFEHHGQHIKAALVAASPSNIIPLIKINKFCDYCPLPHIANTEEIPLVKLQHIEKLTLDLPEIEAFEVIRIYGTAFPDKMALKKFLKRAEAAKDKDHQVLGQAMGLYSTHQTIEGNWLWHPKGTYLRNVLQKLFYTETLSPAFQEVTTIPLGDYAKLHASIFTSRPRMLRDLPVRYIEWVTYEEHCRSHELEGLFKSRHYSADIEQIFCPKEQLEQELISSLQFINKTIKIFPIEHSWHLIILGRNQESSLINSFTAALDKCGIEYRIERNEESRYGQASELQIETRLSDALGREWTCSYLRTEENRSKRFKLRYEDAEGQMHEPVMITRSLYGSLERFIALLIENSAGRFPLWLAPEQIRIIPVSNKTADFAAGIRDKIESAGFRCGIDYCLGGLGEKVHAAELERVPYIVIIGEKEEKRGLITVRSCGNEAAFKNACPLETFIEHLHNEQK